MNEKKKISSEKNGTEYNHSTSRQLDRRGPHYIPPIVASTGFNGTTKLRLVAMKISTDIGLALKKTWPYDFWSSDSASALRSNSVTVAVSFGWLKSCPTDIWLLTLEFPAK